MPLAGGVHDRCSELRGDEAALERAWADPDARVLRVHDGAVALVADGSDIAYLTPSQLGGQSTGYFLGRGTDARPYFAVDAAFSPHPGERVSTIREVGGSISAEAAGLLVHALGLSNWHARHRFCPQCGGVTVVVAGGHIRQCPACGAQHFPRHDPAVIMLVLDDADRCLLGHNPAWAPGRFSTLAGFVEPGESLERAVVREVFEEVGVRVDRVRYEGSQPWPVPNSLMLGFRAHAADPTLHIDGAEITDARWFDRAQLLEAGQRGEVLMPGPVSIARWLIERWFGGPLPPENHW